MADNTETSVAGTPLRRVVSAIRDTAAGCRIVEASTSEDTLLSHCRTLRVESFNLAVSTVPVIAPFPYISAHIIKIQFVRLELTDRMSRTTVIPSNPVYQIAACIFGAASRIGFHSSPCSKLPLGFCRKSVFLAGLLAEDLAELHSLFPSDVIHWIVRAYTVKLVESKLSVSFLALLDYTCFHNSFPLGLGDFKLADIKILHSYPVQNFVLVSFFALLRSTAHHELTALYINHRDLYSEYRFLVVLSVLPESNDRNQQCHKNSDCFFHSTNVFDLRYLNKYNVFSQLLKIIHRQRTYCINFVPINNLNYSEND